MTKRVGQITQAVLHCFEGWFEGDVTRMDHALHPELVKRSAGSVLGGTTKQRMLELVADGQGTEDAGEWPLQ